VLNRNAVCSDQYQQPEDLAVTFKPTWAVAALTLLLTSGGSFNALAQDAAADEGQKPPSEQAAPEKPKCVTSDTTWKEKGKAVMFEVQLQNTCDMRLKCTVDAFVTGSRGQAQGHGTIILAAAPKGQTTRNVYAMKVKSAGGMANVSHSCKSL
jgi:hypothetical protein